MKLTGVLLALTATCALTSACGGDDPNAAPAKGPRYADTTALIDKVSRVVYCEPDGSGADTTVYSDRAESCFYTAKDGVEDSMTVATFVNADQQEKGINYLLDSDMNPGSVYVQGNGWLVMTDRGYGPEIAKYLGGRVVQPSS